jgi:hypothetical protein
MVQIVDEAHERNVRAAARAKGELEAAHSMIEKLKKEFADTSDRFQVIGVPIST